jgi:hypothetical protein
MRRDSVVSRDLPGLQDLDVVPTALEDIARAVAARTERAPSAPSAAMTARCFDADVMIRQAGARSTGAPTIVRALPPGALNAEGRVELRGAARAQARTARSRRAAARW